MFGKLNYKKNLYMQYIHATQVLYAFMFENSYNLNFSKL